LPLKEQPRKNVKDYGNLLVSHLFVIIGAWMSNNQKVHNKMRSDFETFETCFFFACLFTYAAVKWKPNVYLIVEQFFFRWKKFAARFQFSSTNKRECIQLSLRVSQLFDG
jgi:hypothetical protein